jgi:hypothetical protein
LTFGLRGQIKTADNPNTTRRDALKKPMLGPNSITNSVASPKNATPAEITENQRCALEFIPSNGPDTATAQCRESASYHVASGERTFAQNSRSGGCAAALPSNAASVEFKNTPLVGPRASLLHPTRAVVLIASPLSC